MRHLRFLAPLLVAPLAMSVGAVPVSVPRSDKTLVEIINGTMGTLPNAVDALANKLPGGLHATADAPPQIVRSQPFVTRDGYRITAFEARGFNEGGDVPMVRFTSIQLEQRPCFQRAEVDEAFHAPSSETKLPAAPSMLPNRYLVMQMPWGRLSFGTSQDSGGCVIAIVGDATGGILGMRMPLPLPQPTTVPGMPDLRRTWPMPAEAYPAE
ncbi:hypothetical protein SAMN02800692_1938 [Luteibacter sp. UNC138MFCol5.1]|uniref:hypothetical protein n=1 Tax=Luteibacter sp. UNC138MFCol5.1 TaxID=1502774 RepID=UPI0008BA7AEC|nr:hypothetical protein [Luteibacter sp. UNC138MFCol5.1]SEO75524.1 hypothetical protein SAMN02800692_1938 [Luteibacter sp. UNC138MFCol5.1]